LLVGMDADVMREHELSAQPRRHTDEGQPHDGQYQAPGCDRGFGLIYAPAAVRRRDRKQHHGRDEVTPARRSPADPLHGEQLYRAGYSGENAHHGSAREQPERHARPERGARIDVSQIAEHDRCEKGDREVDQHRVEGVLDEGDVRSGAGLFAFRKPFHLGGLPFRSGSRTMSSEICLQVFRTRVGIRPGVASLLAATVPVLTGCLPGPMSALDPAGPAALEIATLWWVMFWASAALVLLMTGLGL